MSNPDSGDQQTEDLLTAAKAALEDLRAAIDGKKFTLQAFKVSRRLKQLQAQADLVNRTTAIADPTSQTGTNYYNLAPVPQPQETAINLNALAVATNTNPAEVKAILSEYAAAHGSIGGFTTNQLIKIIADFKSGGDKGVGLDTQGGGNTPLDQGTGGTGTGTGGTGSDGGTGSKEDNKPPPPPPPPPVRAPPADFGSIRGRLDAAIANIAKAEKTILDEFNAGRAFDPIYVQAQQAKGDAERAVQDIKNEITGRGDFGDIMHFLAPDERGKMGFVPNDESWP